MIDVCSSPSDSINQFKKIVDAGISVTLETDAGAQPIRVMGFSELVVKAGIPVLENCHIKWSNFIKVRKRKWHIASWKKADFIVLDKIL